MLGWVITFSQIVGSGRLWVWTSVLTLYHKQLDSHSGLCFHSWICHSREGDCDYTFSVLIHALESR